jgi:transcription elongation factor Elf1
MMEELELERKRIFCGGVAPLVNTDIETKQQVGLIFCCYRCDNSFTEIYEYTKTVDVVGNVVDTE